MKWDETRIKQAFVNMKKEGWDTSKPLKWGFTFMDTEKDKLLDIYNELKTHDYSLESLIFKENLNLWLLYVVKKEVLTKGKLHRRNLSFEDLVDYYEIECYDGWDAQKI